MSLEKKLIPGLSQNARAEQQQQLSQKSLQSLDMLERSTEELTAMLKTRAESNPLLDVRDPVIFRERSMDEPYPVVRAGTSGVSDEYARYAVNNIPQTESLQQLLNRQIAFFDLSDVVRTTLQNMIAEIENSGYFLTDPQRFMHDHAVDEETFYAALRALQACDPPGVGARNLRESLMIQLRRREKENSLAYKILQQTSDELEQHQIPQIARHFNITVEDVHDALKLLRTLSPHPGLQAESNAPDSGIIQPEIEFRPDENGVYCAHVISKVFPTLKLNADYAPVLDDLARAPADEKSYLREQLKEYNALEQALDGRKKTLQRIGEVLALEQQDFLREGPEKLRVLNMGTVAEKLDLHESTISRAVAGKYARTPEGVIPLRAFFTVAAEEGTQSVASALKSRIKALIADENPVMPLSDEQIRAQLAEEGCDIALRTISKYRKELGILNSHQRKRV